MNILKLSRKSQIPERKEKSIRLDLTLRKPTLDFFNEFNYKKTLKILLGVEADGDVSEQEDDNTLNRFKDYEEESYIDNSEAFSDSYPKGKESEIPGFFINHGPLLLKDVPILMQGNSPEQKKTPRKTKRLLLSKSRSKHLKSKPASKKQATKSISLCDDAKLDAAVVGLLKRKLQAHKRKSFPKTKNVTRNSRNTKVRLSSVTLKGSLDPCQEPIHDFKRQMVCSVPETHVTGTKLHYKNTKKTDTKFIELKSDTQKNFKNINKKANAPKSTCKKEKLPSKRVQNKRGERKEPSKYLKKQKNISSVKLMKKLKLEKICAQKRVHSKMDLCGSNTNGLSIKISAKGKNKKVIVCPDEYEVCRKEQPATPYHSEAMETERFGLNKKCNSDWLCHLQVENSSINNKVNPLSIKCSIPITTKQTLLPKKYKVAAKQDMGIKNPQIKKIEQRCEISKFPDSYHSIDKQTSSNNAEIMKTMIRSSVEISGCGDKSISFPATFTELWNPNLHEIMKDLPASYTVSSVSNSDKNMYSSTKSMETEMQYNEQNEVKNTCSSLNISKRLTVIRKAPTHLLDTCTPNPSKISNEVTVDKVSKTASKNTSVSVLGLGQQTLMNSPPGLKDTMNSRSDYIVVAKSVSEAQEKFANARNYNLFLQDSAISDYNNQPKTQDDDIEIIKVVQNTPKCFVKQNKLIKPLLHHQVPVKILPKTKNLLTLQKKTASSILNLDKPVIKISQQKKSVLNTNINCSSPAKQFLEDVKVSPFQKATSRMVTDKIVDIPLQSAMSSILEQSSSSFNKECNPYSTNYSTNISQNNTVTLKNAVTPNCLRKNIHFSQYDPITFQNITIPTCSMSNSIGCATVSVNSIENSTCHKLDSQSNI